MAVSALSSALSVNGNMPAFSCVQCRLYKGLPKWILVAFSVDGDLPPLVYMTHCIVY